MQRVLIVYATREGQTEKVARRIADELTAADIAVRIVDAKEVPADAETDLGEFDLLVFGASMHAGGLEPGIVDLIERNQARIAQAHRSFFLVLLSAATKDPELREKSLADARDKMEEQLPVSFDDREMIAGALAYSKYSLPVRWIMRRIAGKAGGDTDTSRDYEYTDWQQVERYAQRLLEFLPGTGAATLRYSLKTKISTSQYQETRAFYETVFGMSVAEEWDDPDDVGVILAFPRSREEAYLEVYQVEDRNNLEGLSLQFRVDNLADFMTTLPDGTDFEGPLDRPWGSTYLYLRDPNNIQVVVYEGGL